MASEIDDCPVGGEKEKDFEEFEVDSAEEEYNSKLIDCWSPSKDDSNPKELNKVVSRASFSDEYMNDGEVKSLVARSMRSFYFRVVASLVCFAEPLTMTMMFEVGVCLAQCRRMDGCPPSDAGSPRAPGEAYEVLEFRRRDFQAPVTSGSWHLRDLHLRIE